MFISGAPAHGHTDIFCPPLILFLVFYFNEQKRQNLTTQTLQTYQPLLHLKYLPLSGCHL